MVVYSPRALLMVTLPKLHLPTVAGFTFDHLSVCPSDVRAQLSALDTSKACEPDSADFV